MKRLLARAFLGLAITACGSGDEPSRFDPTGPPSAQLARLGGGELAGSVGTALLVEASLVQPGTLVYCEDQVPPLGCNPSNVDDCSARHEANEAQPVEASIVEVHCDEGCHATQTGNEIAVSADRPGTYVLSATLAPTASGAESTSTTITITFEEADAPDDAGTDASPEP